MANAGAMGLLGKIFTWWNGATIGTMLYSWRNGTEVGSDALGNRYYSGPNGKRWVIYHGSNDASRVASEWHGWLHHTNDIVPGENAPPVRPWQAESLPNPTGTLTAYRPRGALERGGHRAAATGDYRPWSPDTP